MKTKTSKSASYKLVHTLALGVLALAANQANASGYTFTALGTFPDSSDQSANRRQRSICTVACRP